MQDRDKWGNRSPLFVICLDVGLETWRKCVRYYLLPVNNRQE